MPPGGARTPGNASRGRAPRLYSGAPVPSPAMTRAPTATIHVPAMLRACCEGDAEIAIAAPSVRGALEEIGQRHPALYRSVCDETGAVRRHINLFVNESHVRDRDGLDTPLAPGDVLTILPAVSGG